MAAEKAMNEDVAVTRHDDGAIVTLNRPHVLNALNHDLRDAFIAAMSAQNDDTTVKAVVITGAGEKAFSVGLDMAVSVTLDETNVEAWLRGIYRFFQAIRDMDKPTVAAVNGYATGLGLQTALHCDLRFGHPAVRISQPEIAAGVPSVLGHWAMNALMGWARAVEVSLSCRYLGAEESCRYGLLNGLVPADQLLEHAITVARDLGSRPPTSLWLTKQRLREITQAGFDEAIGAAIRLQKQAYGSGEPQRLARAFLDRRGR